MKLDRDRNSDGRGKYALINLRKMPYHEHLTNSDGMAAAIIRNPECLEFGANGMVDEFFVIKLRDIHAQAALLAYAKSVGTADIEYAQAIYDLALRAGPDNPFCKKPD